MAARKPASVNAPEPAPHEVETVALDGVDVQVDLTFIRSWPGARLLARMSSSQLGDGERFAAMVDYYSAAVPNVDEVAEAVGGQDAEASLVFEFLGRAVREVAPKN